MSVCQLNGPNLSRSSSVKNSSVNETDPGCEFPAAKWKLPPSAFDFLSFDHLFSKQSAVYLPLWTLSILCLSFFFFLIKVDGIRRTIWNLLPVSWPLSGQQPTVIIFVLMDI